MVDILLTKIRLSTYFWFFFVLFLLAAFFIPTHTFDSGSLTLFSVNSFLYGFYISPILSAQKARIDALHQIVRSEANALFAIVLNLKKLPRRTRNHLQSLIILYIQAKLRHNKINSGEEEYEAIITYCVEYKGEHEDAINAVLKDIVANQSNRTNFNMQVGNRVFANEWHVMLILFSITLGFILSIAIPGDILMQLVKALLCTGLTMLIVNLVKLNALTHKKAQLMWNPLIKLVHTNFYRLD